MDGKTFVLKASIDRRTKRVLLAECEKDFADILFSFLTMPLGSIVSLIRSQHPNFELGCLSNLYNSIEKLDPGFVKNESFRANLLNPQNLAISQCKSLIIDGGGHTSYLVGSLNSNCTCDRRQSFAYPAGAPCLCGSSRWRTTTPWKAQSLGGMFVKGQPKFVVSDELEVLPASTEACLSLLSRLGGIDGEKDDQSFTIGKNEVINLLMLSLVSKTALTETLLQTELSEENFGVVSIGKFRVLGGLFEENQKIHIRLSNSKSTKKVFYAEANGDFINLLSSFLTIPLGQMVREIYYGGPSSVCITRLYKSVLNLDAAKYFISFQHREILRSPSLSFESTLISSYGTVCFSSSLTTMNTLPLALTTTQRIAEARSYGGFVKREAMFSVSGDLRIGPRSPVKYLSAISKLSADGLQDVETSDAYVGQKEAFRLLVASVFCGNALNEAFQVYATTQRSDVQPTTSFQLPRPPTTASIQPRTTMPFPKKGKTKKVFQVHPTAQRSDQPTTSMQIPQTKEALVFLPSGKHKRFKSLLLDWLLDILVILFFSWCLWILFNIR